MNPSRKAARLYISYLLWPLLVVVYTHIVHAIHDSDGRSTQSSTAGSRAQRQSEPVAGLKNVDDGHTFHRFLSRPDIHAPVWFVRHYQDRSLLASGYWFLAFYNGLEQSVPGEHWVGPHIYDANGELVWAGSSAFQYWNVFDFGVAQVGSEQKLTLIHHHEKKAFTLNSQYQIEKQLSLVNDNDDEKADMHSFNVMDDGKSALIIHNRLWNTTHVSLQQDFAGPCFAYYQGFREISLESENNEVIFEWYAEDWIELEESTYQGYDGTVASMCAQGWDALHFNSIEKFPDGDYLLSARHTDALYKISHQNGSIVWRLGGTRSDFRMIGNATFSRQHTAHVRSQNDTYIIIDLFDNAIGDPPFNSSTNAYSRGLVLLLDIRKMAAEVIAEYPHPNAHFVNARGSLQTLANGNVFTCWAYASRISEHTPDGQLLMQAVLGGDVDSYRGFKHPWTGLPTRPPDLYTRAVRDRHRIITDIYVSWNGATEVYKWTFHMPDGKKSTCIGDRLKDGFETRFTYNGHARCVFAEAFDKCGRFLGRSEVVSNALPPVLGEDSEPTTSMRCSEQCGGQGAARRPTLLETSGR